MTQTNNDLQKSVYVSITGLKMKSWLYYPQFFLLASAAMAQALNSKGLVSADARTIDGFHHTLSVWENEASMRDYLGTGAHLTAMRAFKSIATGKTVGYLASARPTWSDAHAIWLAQAVEK